jgi:hypothetical protein
MVAKDAPTWSIEANFGHFPLNRRGPTDTAPAEPVPERSLDEAYLSRMGANTMWERSRAS